MRAPAFQWYPKDCDTDERVRLMTHEQFGLYVRCLNHAWMNDGLPQDLAELSQLFSQKYFKFRKHWSNIRSCFVEKDGRLVSPKQEAQRTQQKENSEVKRKAANQGWNARAMHVQCSASATASATAEELPPVVPPPGDVLPKATPPKRAKPEVRPETSVWFEGFWDASWRRGGKREALEAADKKIITSAERQQAMAKMLHDRPEQLTHDLEHRKHLSSWINSGRWSDPIEAEPAPMGLVVANGQARGSPLSTWERKDLEFKQKLKERLLSQNGGAHAIQR